MAPSRSEVKGSMENLWQHVMSSSSSCNSSNQQRSASHPNIVLNANGAAAAADNATNTEKRKSHGSIPCSIEQYTRPTAMSNGKAVAANLSRGNDGGGRNHQAQMEKRYRLFKTEICRTFEETGSCKYGSKCQFAHSQEELRPIPRHPRYKTEVCRTFWEQGTCPYGKRCCFIHNENSAIDTSTKSSGTGGSVAWSNLAAASTTTTTTTDTTPPVAMSSQPFPAAISTPVCGSELFEDCHEFAQETFDFSTSSMKSLADTTRVVCSIQRRASVEQKPVTFSNGALWCDDQMMMVSSLAVARRPSVPHSVVLCPMSNEDVRSDFDPHGVLKLLDDE